MSNNSNQTNSSNEKQDSKKNHDGLGVPDSKKRDFDRVNTNPSSIIKKGNDSQPLTTKKEE